MFGKNKLDRSLILSISALFAVLLLVVTSVQQFRESSRLENELKEKTENIGLQLRETWYSNANSFKNASIDLDDKSKSLIKGIHYSPNMSDSLETANSANLRGVLGIKATSLNYRNPDNQPDELETIVLHGFEKIFAGANPISADTVYKGQSVQFTKDAVWILDESSGSQVYRSFVPLKINESCITCHGTENEVIPYIKDNYDGGFDYKIGDLRGVISVKTSAAQLSASKSDSLLITIAIIVIGLALVIFIVNRLVKRIVSEPISRLVEVAKSIAGGNLAPSNLNRELEGDLGELYNSFHQMSGNLRGLVQEISDLAFRVNTTASEIRKTTGFVSKAADDQAAIVRNTSTAVKEMSGGFSSIAQDGQTLTFNVSETTSSIQQLISNIQEAAKNIQDSTMIINNIINDVQEGRFAIDQINNGMQEVNLRMDQMVTTIQKLEKSSRDIGRVTDTINKIAKQTNLLAVNAAIESALAGEAGRGFAVVAEEVRKLASRSTEATREIEELVIGIQGETSKAVQAALSATQTTQEGVELVRNAEAVLERITQHASRSSTIMSRLTQMMDYQIKNSQQVVLKASEMTAKTSKVTNSTGEQMRKGDVIVQSIENINTSANKNREAAIEIGEFTKQLVSQADSLNISVQKFKLSDR